MKAWPVLCAVPLALLLAACRSPTPPRGVEPLRGFDVARYLGTWYEVARLDNRFERGLEQVSAHYALREDGGISVLNRGYDAQRRRWRQSQGKAYFIDAPTTAALKVSFFGPFYGGYNVIALDDDYRYALVCGPNRRYLWILSRTPTLPPAVRQAYIRRADALGFAVEQLRWADAVGR
ncbi:outer membrane lipoprotein Blc [Edwardsiella piscicida]|uniref:outer membrane lipoprotein Blc n=1 Tax=Edwardsiella piscicida TaxID=1263550 RepID=UPI0002C0F569|nr:outer membrane lipoprotein Blc [Edwardsiella piscicida]AGH72896.1 Outer membrane lipoprotein Blc [Edwardsiella piscicida C07-087]EKS7765524.1 outer membrane lipoprotein Blc [Edwardsiella piscicida]EKS7768533.1 outer membrane lipoprotein Blc [Edwardsiella piscicida]EKS7778534.1 outer membrane lipoprotein Blc [Edwardsiella piscicida]EKS7781726.1 outer membrane lipoprotein Blc [Edwardsiella piscicida]